MAIPKESIDPDADKIVRRLRRNGHAAFLVGGCVRDLLLVRKPKDFDICTSATPTEIKDLFRNCRIIGRRFRLAHIFFGQKIIETSTFRANPREGTPIEEVEELLIRRDNVFGTAEEDARRRDFTINGLFYDVEAEEVTDYVGGLADLDARLVRTIGDPDIRFREDPVRILRAIKFAARLGFDIEPATYAAILAHRGEIPKSAAPRVLEEVYRLLRGGAARRSMELLLQTGVAETLAPELAWMFGHGEPTTPPPPPLAGADPAWLADRHRRAWRVLDEIDALSAPKARKAEVVEPAAPEAKDEPAETIDGAADKPEKAEKAEKAEKTRRGEGLIAESGPSNSLLLAALVAPFLPEPEVDQGQLIESLLMRLVARLRVSRRDGERARQVLLAQWRIAPGKRRRARPMTLVKRDYFGEALALYEMMSSSQTAPADEVQRWRSLWRGSQGPGGPVAEETSGRPPAAERAAEPLEGDQPGRKRRRRRRGGRRRRKDVASEATPAVVVEAAAPEVVDVAAAIKTAQG